MDMFDDELPAPATRELPLADYPHLSGYAIEASLSGLDSEEVEILKRYESTHRDRTPLVRLLTARLKSLRAGRPARAS
jgi:hypothetical protein